MKKIILLLLILSVHLLGFGEVRKIEKEESKLNLIIEEQGKHGPIVFAISVSQSGEIESVSILESAEVKGAKIERKRFLRQFIGKSSKGPLKVNRDIDAITGATISSKAAAEAVREALMIWKELSK